MVKENCIQGSKILDMEKVEIFSSILSELKSHQDQTNFQIFYESEIRRAKLNGITVIPSSGKQPKIKWKTEEDRKKANDIVITDTISLFLLDFISLVDIDDVSVLSEKYGITQDEIENVANVRTRRGYHIFIAEPLPSLALNKNIGIEIKHGDHLCVFPGSRYFNKEYNTAVFYKVLNTKINESIEAIENEKIKRAILDAISNNKVKEEEFSTKTHNVGRDSVNHGDLQKLKEAILKVYTKGNRQNIVIYVTAYLLKNGIDEETVKEFIDDIIKDDEEKDMRRAGMEETVRKFKNGEEVKGYEGLREYLREEEIKITTATKSTYAPFYPFIKKDSKLYYEIKIKSKGKTNKEEIPIGEYIEILGKYFNLDSKTYHILAKHRDNIYVNLPTEPKEIEKIFKTPILKPELFRFFLYKQIEEAEKRGIGLYLERCGWFSSSGKKVFITPCYTSDKNIKYVFDSEKMKDVYKRFTITLNEEEKRIMHDKFKFELERGSLIALLYCAVVSSILLRELDLSYSVLITGEPGVGKTTIVKALLNAFYDNKSKYTLYSTQLYRMQILYQLSDLPVLLDETALEKDEKIEVLLYLVESQRTKGKSNVNYGTESQSRRNVLFITSEREIETDRLGAFRRNLTINLHEEDIEDINVYHYIIKSNLIGWGYDLVDFYMKNGLDVSDIEHSKFIPQAALLAGLKLLEKFYQQEFPATRKKIDQVCLEHMQKTDYFSFCLEALQSFYSLNLRNFYDEKANYTILNQDHKVSKKPNIPGVFYGFRHKNILYLTLKAFEKFLTEYKINRKSFLRAMRDKNRLIYNDRDYYRFSSKKLPIPIEIGIYTFIAISFDDNEMTKINEIENIDSISDDEKEVLEYIQSNEDENIAKKDEKRSHSDFFIYIDDEFEDYLNYILEKD